MLFFPYPHISYANINGSLEVIVTEFPTSHGLNSFDDIVLILLIDKII